MMPPSLPPRREWEWRILSTSFHTILRMASKRREKQDITQNHYYPFVGIRSQRRSTSLYPKSCHGKKMASFLWGLYRRGGKNTHHTKKFWSWYVCSWQQHCLLLNTNQTHVYDYFIVQCFFYGLILPVYIATATTVNKKYTDPSLSKESG